ncbi:MAG: hypothetical protein LC725_08840 [Lentisphaerae bacterium]|nr:hypothetical protein [Lentisphaerota bacterium]
MKCIVLIIAAVALLVGCRDEPVEATSNSLLVIAPYKHAGTWVFDEPSRGLKQEPFVAGIPQMMDKLVADIPDADQGFRLIFSAQEFPGYTHKLEWKRKDTSGNWYYCPQFNEEGWLCPALFKFFKEAPKDIYVKAEAK